ncbi:Transposase and inactivated derivatives [Serratia liquefaciens]|nr:Transposase and inactivated derivatives [Serratia liquefaciens]
MDEKSLYAHILNLTASWQVKALSLDEKVGSVTVTVGIAENVLLSCPTCGKTCPVHDHRHRKWRHLDTCQFTTVVEADVPESCARTMVVRPYLFHGPDREADTHCCSSRSSSHG